MPVSPDTDIVDFLGAQVGALTKDTNLFRGVMVPPDAHVPHECAFVLINGGPGPEAYVGSTNSVERYYSSVQIIVRSDERDYPAGLTLARSVRDALHHGAVSGYLDCRAEQSEPIYTGEDEEGHHMWSINIELWHEQ